MCIATVVVRSRTSARAPGRRTVRSQRVARRAPTHRQTVPTGFSGVPPPGPAIPVIPMPMSAPSALARAGGQRRARPRARPRRARSISAAGTPASAVLASLE